MTKIMYSRTAYVTGCKDEVLDNLRDSLPNWADGNENICSAWEDIISYLDDEDNKNDSVYPFVMNIHNKIEGEIGDVIFSK